jgi:hypothetical protein
VRVTFVALSFIHLAGPILYAALWLVIPFSPGGRSVAEEGLRRAQEIAARLFGRDGGSTVPGGPPA